MHARPTQRGTTLIESMVAMAVLAIGSMGMVGLHVQGVRIEGDSRHVTRATAIAQDLLSQMELWAYTDPRLADITVSNLTTLGDPAFALERATDPVASRLVDHAEGELTAGGAEFHGLPAQAVNGYERFWSVVSDPSDDSNSNGVVDGIRVASIVRWRAGSGWRRVVLLGYVRNPAEAR